jgi:type I restriction enzyme M protein
LALDVSDVQQTVLDSDEFKKFAADVRGKVGDWFASHRPILQALNAKTVPTDLISVIGDDLLVRFKDTALLDEYDAYEQLMTYWHSTMHDDVFLIMNEVWMDAAKPRRTIEDKERKLTENPDLVIGSGRSATKYKMDLIPPRLIVARYLADEQADIDQLTAKAEEAAHAVQEYVEEHAVEGGLLADAMDDDKITKALAAARLKEAKREGSDPEEIKALRQLIDLYEAEAATKKAVKEAQASLDLSTLKKYGDLTEPQVKQLVLDDKWHGAIATRVAGEVDSLTLELVRRIKQLGQRYAETVSDLDAELEKLESRVKGHLTAMGAES